VVGYTPGSITDMRLGEASGSIVEDRPKNWLQLKHWLIFWLSSYRKGATVALDTDKKQNTSLLGMLDQILRRGLCSQLLYVQRPWKWNGTNV